MAQTSDTGMTPAPEGDGTGLPPAVPVETLREGPTKQSGSIGPAGRAALTARFDLLGLERLDYTLTTRPWRTGILVEGTLSADVVQTCVVTLDPVTTRIDEEFVRGLLPRDELYANVRPGIELELEIDPELDDIPEELTDPVGLGEILADSLALALPAYPRAEGVEPVTTTAAPKNVTPLGDADVKPFAALEALKARFNGGDEG